MTEYTATTEDVRGAYRAWHDGQGDDHALKPTWSAQEFDRWLAAHDAEVQAKALVQGFSDGVNFIDDQPGPWGAGMVAGRAEAARRRAEAEGVIDL